MSGVPSVKLEHYVNGSWLDVTSRLLWGDATGPVQLVRGMSEDGGVLVGTGIFTLDNSDGELTPKRAASTSYPYLVRYRPVRFQVYIGGSWRARHYGFLDSEVITFGNEPATDCRVTWTSIDHFGMAALKPLRSVAVEATAAKGPLAYYPLTDAETAAASDQSAYPRPVLAVQQYGTGGEIGWAAGALLNTEQTGGVTFTPASDNGLYLLSEGTMDLPTSWSLTVRVTPAAKDGYVCQIGTDSYSIGIWYDTSTDKMSAIETKLDSSGDPIDYVLSTSTSAVDASFTETLTVTSTTVKLGSSGTTGTRHGSTTMKGASISVGGAFAVESGRQRMYSGEVKHLAIWSGAFPSVTADIVTGPSDMFTMSSAVEKVMEWAGLTVTVATQGTDHAVVMQKTDGLTPLDVINNYARGSLTRIYCLGDGTIRQSAYDYTPTTVAAAAGDISLGIEWAANPGGDFTDALMTWPDGSTYSATETAFYRSSIDLPGALPTALGRSVADWIVAATKGDPGFPVAPFDLLTIPSSDALALLECGSILSIPGLPTQLPSTTQTGIVFQNITETIGASEWSLTVATDSDPRDNMGIVGDATRGVTGTTYLAGPLGTITAGEGVWKAGDPLTHTNLNARGFTGGMMQAGSVSITPVANTPTSTTVTFPSTFPSTPVVVASYVGGSPGSEVKEVSVTSVSTTGCTVWAYRTTTDPTTVTWIAAVN